MYLGISYLNKLGKIIEFDSRTIGNRSNKLRVK